MSDSDSKTTPDWQPINTAPRDGTEIIVRDDRGREWPDAYVVIQAGGEEGFPISAVEWRRR